ncbi:MAG: branched-chain amino acid ABC transporter permease [Deltaproteobacteria bacterium]|jgi:branched-chain amino acid transport system permease protein|nr:branched-chain amino acid ABC transporter permease [Deltaproteobacteria bacterium]MBT4640465.1 branched-chain amino acid ABC transporter permease [Deltaproteobacteria bacterium]MBT6502923.1 branched-chain amino acid ABC transporter permease [Deltaproteobacteria bacterium]MBT6615224.1 branched-chain amino acid ABC transporter permease [Deltaproteobacteria bacterium]MBT7154426.1 branched-chain amino acid ABC transporter permease [Deltaproteobacteria bacterium]
MEFYVISLLNSLVFGMLLFMLSSGLTLIFGMMGVLNFAHASFYMVGAYFGYQISAMIGFWPALVIAPVLVGVLGAAIERYGLRTVHKHGHVAELLFTFGVAFMIEELILLIWGRVAMNYQVPASLDFTIFTLFESDFPVYRLFMLTISVVMFVALYLLLTKTRTGIIIQAALTHADGVGMLGHNVPRVFMLVFGGGSALAGLAGVIGGNYLVTSPSMAILLGPIVFVVIVVGGMGSLTGALIASLLIAALQTFAVGYDYSLVDLLAVFNIELGAEPWFPDLWRIKIESTGPLLPYLLMVIMLIFRPKGIMGERES